MNYDTPSYATEVAADYPTTAKERPLYAELLMQIHHEHEYCEKLIRVLSERLTPVTAPMVQQQRTAQSEPSGPSRAVTALEMELMAIVDEVVSIRRSLDEMLQGVRL